MNKPKTLTNYHVKDFRYFPGQIESQPGLFATDPETGVEYRIDWCGNGPHSHYCLSIIKDSGEATGGWYVYIHQPVEPLFREIYLKEMELIYKEKNPKFPS